MSAARTAPLRRCAARALAAACAVAATVAAPADAAEVAGTVVARSGDVLSISDPNGLTQNLLITSDAQGVTVTERGSTGFILLEGSGCTAESAFVVRCEPAARIDVTAGAGADVVESFAGTPASLSGGTGADLLRGGPRDDVLAGGGGDDELIGAAGADRMLGDSGDDVLDGGVGDDDLTGGLGADDLVGGPGADVVRYHDLGRSRGVTVTVGAGGADDGSADDLRLLGAPRLDAVDGSVEAVAGSRHADRLVAAPGVATTLDGGDDDDELQGGDAGDVLRGGAGADRVDGAGGDDRLDGGDGADDLVGGPGFDTVTYADRGGLLPERRGVTVTVGAGADDGSLDDAAASGRRDDVDATVEAVEGTVADAAGEDDTLTGSGAAETLSGLAGDDVLDGAAGADTFGGGAGDDRIQARDGAADAAIACGPGDDTVVADATDPVDADCELVLRPGPAATSPAPSTGGVGPAIGGVPPTSPPPTPEALPAAPAVAGGRVGSRAAAGARPDTRIVSGPGARVRARRTLGAAVRLRFRATTPGARFECRLRGRAAPRALRRFRRCPARYRLSGLRPGRYVLEVRAVDRAGRADRTPARRAWRVLPPGR